jgi:predicted nucleotide-binding protein (sugar kinase/HSP70/actin superfamily)
MKDILKKKRIMLSYCNDLTVFLSTIFRAYDLNVIYLGRTTKKTLSFATKYSPEAWCFDTKIMLGQLFEGLENKADILTMPGAWGGDNNNCFLGYLTKGIIQKKVEEITKKKVNIWFYNINAMEVMTSYYTEVYKNLSGLRKFVAQKPSRLKIIKAIILGIKKMKMASELKEKILSSPQITDKEKLFSIYDQFIDNMIFKADTLKESEEIYSQALKEIAKLKTSRLDNEIKIGIVGDFSHTLFAWSPFMDIEKFLLEEGISVNQPLSAARYYYFLSPFYSKKNLKRRYDYLPQKISGSDIMTILCSLYLKDKVDGLIHTRTFGCTPEETANEVLISNKKDFPPILSLSYDAHTTEENLRVRIEAFIDMLKRKGKKK